VRTRSEENAILKGCSPNERLFNHDFIVRVMQIVPLDVIYLLLLVYQQNLVNLQQRFSLDFVAHGGCVSQGLNKFVHRRFGLFCHDEVKQSFQVLLKLPQVALVEQIEPVAFYFGQLFWVQFVNNEM